MMELEIVALGVTFNFNNAYFYPICVHLIELTELLVKYTCGMYKFQSDTFKNAEWARKKCACKKNKAMQNFTR